MSGEAKAFHRLKEKVTRPEDRFERIENGIGVGNLDVNYCMAGTEGWIEIKCPHEMVRIGTPLLKSQHGVSIDQKNWFLAQHRARGVAYLFIATPERLMLIPGRVVAFLPDPNALTALEWNDLAIWSCIPPIREQERWFNLREILCRREG